VPDAPRVVALDCRGRACGSPAIVNYQHYHGLSWPSANVYIHHSGRDFFKLSHIELRCETTPGQSQIVEPYTDAAPDPPVRDIDHSSPVAVHQPPSADMEVDTRVSHAPQLPPPPPGPVLQPRQEHHHHYVPAPLQHTEVNRQSLPPPLPSPSFSSSTHALPQRSPSNPPLLSPSPAVKPAHDVQFAHPPSKESTAVSLANHPRDYPPVMLHAHSPAEQNRTNGHYYPRSSKEVSLDAIERLQTQFSQNSAALVAQTREMQLFKEAAIHREETLRREFQTQLNQKGSNLVLIEQAVRRLEREMHDSRELLNTLAQESRATREQQAHRPMGQGGVGFSAQDSALELVTQQVAVISQKANEVDTLKITIEIMKNKIQRLEESTAAGAVAVAVSAPLHSSQHVLPSSREPSVHPAQSTQQVPSYHTGPAVLHYNNTTAPSVHGPGSFHSHGSHPPAAPEVAHGAEPAPSQIPSGWASVNKRPRLNGAESLHGSPGQSPDSPKRPKLTPIEPRRSFGSSQVPSQQQVVYDSMDTDDSVSRFQTHSHSLPSQSHSYDSAPEASFAQSTLASQHSQHSAYLPYGTQDGPSDDSWRPESQRHIEYRAQRGRPRGSGVGSRGGRGRKSLPALGTPEWEKDDWQGITESQTGPDGYYNYMPIRSGRGIIRRGDGGSGGVSRGRPISSSGRAVSLGMQGVTTGVGLPMDPYSHTKRTRTKPIRNSDGVLIRKDGRPDMRSQSSAANLRKVHARNGEQKDGDRDFTPTSSLYQMTNAEPSTPGTPRFVLPNQGLTASFRKKHNLIMAKMFPGGVDETRKEHDYARKVFEEEQRHTAQPREQHHHHQHQSHHNTAEGGPLHIKREQTESQSPNDGDVDMDQADKHADDEGQTPSDLSDTSVPYHETVNNIAEPTHDPKEASVQYREAVNSEADHTHVPQGTATSVTQSTADTSHTIGATPTSTT
jgi:hypothetical protein